MLWMNAEDFENHFKVKFEVYRALYPSQSDFWLSRSLNGHKRDRIGEFAKKTFKLKSFQISFGNKHAG